MSRTTHDQAATHIEEATPDLETLQQSEPDEPVVAVRIKGPTETHELPARVGAAFPMDLAPDYQNVVGGVDFKRKCLILLANDQWLYAQHPGQPGIRWPADVPLVLTHADAVYAKAHPDATEDPVVLSVIAEVWAD